ncbi:hypothetical protein ACIGQE_20590 [Streptomyces sp. NPDC053429]|uniref:hypothetical protein n=1 Tax=Streptomyces sp. NPDC053429 TaxID=3365702 RepID=UPI0037D66EC1
MPACWFGVDRSTITRATGEVRPMLAERGCSIATAPLVIPSMTSARVWSSSSPSRPIRPTSAPLSTNCSQSGCLSRTARTFSPRTPGVNWSPPSPRRPPPSPPADGAG